MERVRVLRGRRDLGTIEKGKLADVIVVAGKPLQNMAAMKRVAHVVKNGVRYEEAPRARTRHRHGHSA